MTHAHVKRVSSILRSLASGADKDVREQAMGKIANLLQGNDDLVHQIASLLESAAGSAGIEDKVKSRVAGLTAELTAQAAGREAAERTVEDLRARLTEALDANRRMGTSPQQATQIGALERENAHLKLQLMQAQHAALLAENDALTLSHISQLTNTPDPVMGVENEIRLRKRAQLQAFTYRAVMQQQVQENMPAAQQARSIMQLEIEAAHQLAEYTAINPEADRYLDQLLLGYPNGRNGFIADIESARLGRLSDADLKDFHNHMFQRLNRVSTIAPVEMNEANTFIQRFEREALGMVQAAQPKRPDVGSYRPGYRADKNPETENAFVGRIADALAR